MQKQISKEMVDLLDDQAQILLKAILVTYPDQEITFSHEQVSRLEALEGSGKLDDIQLQAKMDFRSKSVTFFI